MEILIWVGLIIGIFSLLIIGCMMLLRSSEKVRYNTKQHKEMVNQIKETNKQLDEALIELKQLNEPLEKVNEIFTKINTKVFK